MHDVSRERDTEYGTIYEIAGPIPSPDGRNPNVRIVWMIDVGSSYPRLITLVPLELEP